MIALTIMKRHYDPEMMDDFSITDQRLTLALDELKIINKYLGGRSVTLAGINSLISLDTSEPVSFADIGAGAADIVLSLHRNNLNDKEQKRLISMFSTSTSTQPELAENILVRVCGLLLLGKMSIDEATATFRCLYFRRNITHHEIEQIFTIYNSLQNAQNYLNDSLEDNLAILKFIMQLLTQPPADEGEDSELFEIRDNQPDYEQFSLFLQEHMGFQAGRTTSILLK